MAFKLIDFKVILLKFEYFLTKSAYLKVGLENFLADMERIETIDNHKHNLSLWGILSQKVSKFYSKPTIIFFFIFPQK